MSSPLYPIIKSRFSKAFGREKGLTVIEAPTGSGKTYTTAETIAEQMKLNHGKERHIFIYLTPSKVNRDEFFEKITCHLPDYEDIRRRVISVEGTLDAASNAISLVDQGKLEIPPSIKNDVLYRRLRRFLLNWQKSDDKAADEQTGQKYEKEFRQWVKKSIKNEARELNEGNKESGRIDARQYVKGKGQEEWGWIEKFWPMSRSRSDYDVLIMTPQKFLSPVDTIFDGVLDLTGDSFLENVSGIVIDESDYVNDVMLDSLCKAAADQDYDPLVLLHVIHELMGGAKTAEEWFSPRFLRFAEYGNGWQSVSRNLDEIMGQIRDVYEKYHLGCNLVMDEDSGTRLGKGFMFTFESVNLCGRKAYVVYDEKYGQNVLKILKPKQNEKEEGVRLDRIIRECQAVLHRLGAFLGYAAKAYENGKNSLTNSSAGETDGMGSTSGERLVDSVSAVETTLNDLHIGEYKTIRQMASAARKNGYANGNSVRKYGYRMGDMSVYSCGVSLARVLQHASHDSYVEVRLSELKETPADILCRCAERTNVILVSATAGVDSVKNFPVDKKGYIRARLGRGFMDEDESEHSSIMRTADEANDLLRKQYRINVSKIPGIDMATAMRMEPDVFWGSIFSKTENILAACSWDRRLKEDTNGVYRKVRIRNRLDAFKTFLKSDGSAGLMFVASLNRVEIEATISLMERLAKELKPEDRDYWKCARSLRAGSWNDVFPQVQKDSARKPVFIITAYQTAGQGKDILLPHNGHMDEYAHISGGDEDHRDIDFTYLEKPTHILTINDSVCADTKQQLKSIVEVRELMERGEISRGEYFYCMNLLVDPAYARSNPDGDEMENTNFFAYNRLPSSMTWTSRIVYQAIGRTTRSAWRRRNITIVLDPEMVKTADASAFDDTPLTYEAQEIFNTMHWDAPEPSTTMDKRMARKIAVRSSNVGAYLQKIASTSGWNDDAVISNWREMREQAMRDPTISRQKLFGLGMLNLSMGMYASVPSGTQAIYYRTGKAEDYRKATEVSFKPFPDPIRAENRDRKIQSMISEANSKLPTLMLNPTVSEYFDRHGYAKHWNENNEFWMVPSAYNNIYKGALGEAAGTAIVEKLYGKLDTLDDCPEAFEKFDAYLPPTSGRNSGVMFDFKHWSGYDKTGRQADDYIEWITEKLAIVDKVKPTVLAVIVNSLFTGRGEPHLYDSRILTIPGLIQPDGHLHERNIRILCDAIDNLD